MQAYRRELAKLDSSFCKNRRSLGFHPSVKLGAYTQDPAHLDVHSVALRVDHFGYAHLCDLDAAGQAWASVDTLLSDLDAGTGTLRVTIQDGSFADALPTGLQ